MSSGGGAPAASSIVSGIGGEIKGILRFNFCSICIGPRTKQCQGIEIMHTGVKTLDPSEICLEELGNVLEEPSV